MFKEQDSNLQDLFRSQLIRLFASTICISMLKLNLTLFQVSDLDDPNHRTFLMVRIIQSPKCPRSESNRSPSDFQSDALTNIWATGAFVLSYWSRLPSRQEFSFNLFLYGFTTPLKISINTCIRFYCRCDLWKNPKGEILRWYVGLISSPNLAHLSPVSLHRVSTYHPRILFTRREHSSGGERAPTRIRTGDQLRGRQWLYPWVTGALFTSF